MFTTLCRIAGLCLGLVLASLLWIQSTVASPALPGTEANTIAHAIFAPMFVDNFNGVLKSGWSWVREDPTHWSLSARPGFMRIVTQKGGLLFDGGSAKNLLLRNTPNGNYMITTRVFYKPTTNFQIAGLLIYQDDNNFLWLGRAYANCPDPACKGNAIYFDHEEGGQVLGGNHSTVVLNKRKAYLRIVHKGTRYIGYYSEDGTNWTKIGKHVVGSGFSPKIGIATSSGSDQDTEINADFDFFRVEQLP